MRPGEPDEGVPASQLRVTTTVSGSPSSVLKAAAARRGIGAQSGTACAADSCSPVCMRLPSALAIDNVTVLAGLCGRRSLHTVGL